MSNSIRIPNSSAIHASVRLPGSKSITNRALVCAALANGTSTLRGALDSEDSRVMVNCLEKLGVAVRPNWEIHELDVSGCNASFPANDVDLFVENSGTTIRFLTAACALGNGTFRLDGIERMRERPIGDLLDALNQLGVKGTSDFDNGCPPITIETTGIVSDSNSVEVSIRGNISSQYLSGLLMTLPLAKVDSKIRVQGDLVSKPYIEMTRQVVRSFGGQIECADDFSTYNIPGNQSYTAREFDIEPDASAASYFWAAAAITGGEVKVLGLNRDSLQGDVAFCDCLKQMGCKLEESADGITVFGKELSGIDVDMNSISDTVQTLAVVALFAKGTTRISGVAHNRHKETDRIGDLARELRKLGAEVEEFEDGLIITPRQLSGATIETYNDHRMAMALALAGLRVPNVEIANPSCTRKTYPGYFDDLFEIL